MNSTKKAVALVQLCTRKYGTPPAKVSSHFEKLKIKQARFQCDDGLPVFLKGGVLDKILYQTTFVLIIVGGGMMGKLFWDLAVPKKN